MPPVTHHHAVALSLVPHLPRVGLTERLQQDDPELLELAEQYQCTLPAALGAAQQAGIEVLPWNAPGFPPLLLALPDCPPAVWYAGDAGCFARPAVAIVGSRAATAVALELADSIAGDLAAAGIVVVSGLARGVDSAAHRGALRRGATIAVLGSGLDRVYPPEHAALAREVRAAGAVLAEYPPGVPPLPYHFPQRNRLISGLSRAVVVIEAAEGSGSLITASCALEQGRDVMVVPGNALTGRTAEGTRSFAMGQRSWSEPTISWQSSGSTRARGRRAGGQADPGRPTTRWWP